MTVLPVDLAKHAHRPDLGLPVEILSIASANPPYKISQRDALANAAMIYPQFASLHGLFANTGIDYRYTCQPTDWYQRPHTWEERTEVFQEHALKLLEQVALDATARAGLSLGDIDAFVTNTITGLAIPSLDALLMDRLPFSPNVERLPIFGLGCGGGVAGLARAARFAQGRPGRNVLFITVDLCSLCARPNDPSMAMFVAAALFGDGAAGVVLRTSANSTSEGGDGEKPVVLTFGEHTWRNTRHIMGWDVKGDGFGVVLSPELPTLMRNNLGQVVKEFVGRRGMSVRDFKGFLFHPGGRKVLETAEDVLGIDRALLAHSWDVLRDFGNMSSATALFILERAMASGDKGRHLLAAFGPGFSAYFVVLDL
ncbi:3-oxoacyl-[acyl-carrier-protein] synthase III C-terminal domain-containing protein [Hyphomicrobium sp.]|uniref:type III polyketide synthase n=1 Tax=Hyphomicrobium sp. TaxID=82 RepID=UPI001D77EEEA|nr:3-oxoacyl-[acyl-carrier-protein] synthase III C-terminal domain-containing protein [Hyphomicrobium sp.]MBY0558964.1 type III polyketide synthase [Hyphomicrobium sp.]